jgi:hypothetical protein
LLKSVNQIIKEINILDVLKQEKIKVKVKVDVIIVNVNELFINNINITLLYKKCI